MSVELTIGERSFAIAPFKMKELRLSSKFVEQMNVLAKRIDDELKAHERENAALPEEQQAPFQQNLEDLFALSRALCEIIAVGLMKLDAKLDADWIEEQIDLSFLNSLQLAARALLASGGLSAKNVKAPSSSKETGPDQEASTNSSEELSAS